MDPPSTPRAETAILFLTHVWSGVTAGRFARLWREVGSHADCFVLLQSSPGNPATAHAWAAFLRDIGAGEVLRTFDTATLEGQLGYRFLKTKSIKPGCSHFPLLLFSRSAQYRHYWLIEYDVEYRGNWLAFFRTCAQSRADLLALHPRHYSDWPDWYWWKSLKQPLLMRLLGPPRRQMLRKAFLPIARFSAEAVRVIDGAQRRGWRGHNEVLIPTMLVRHSLSIEDLHDVHACCEGREQNPCAEPARLSTVRWRPAISREEFAARGSGPLLFHPAKENWYFDGCQTRAGGQDISGVSAEAAADGG